MISCSDLSMEVSHLCWSEKILTADRVSPTDLGSLDDEAVTLSFSVVIREPDVSRWYGSS